MPLTEIQRAWTESFLGVKLTTQDSDSVGLQAHAIAPQIASSEIADVQTALDRWAQSRSSVIAVLHRLEAAIQARKHPMGEKAIILVKGITANLTATPDTLGKVAELRRYLATDAIVDDAEIPNGFGLEVKIRAPLMKALEALDRVLQT